MSSMKYKILILIGVIVLTYITYSFSVRIYTALKAADRLTEAVNKLHRLEVKNTELKNQLKMVSSPDFIEQQARNKLNLAKEGETIVVISEDKLKQILRSSKDILEEQNLPNYLGWWKLFFK